VYSACGLNAFSFGPNGKLAFTVRWNRGDNGYNASWYGVIDTGIWGRSTPAIPRPATPQPPATPPRGYGPTRPG
jgi:predicted carbohydrate-binding protein with CBM5 and CBM33 domain